jgi:hypothetical protein
LVELGPGFDGPRFGFGFFDPEISNKYIRPKPGLVDGFGFDDPGLGGSESIETNKPMLGFVDGFGFESFDDAGTGASGSIKFSGFIQYFQLKSDFVDGFRSKGFDDAGLGGGGSSKFIQ